NVQLFAGLVQRFDARLRRLLAIKIVTASAPVRLKEELAMRTSSWISAFCLMMIASGISQTQTSQNDLKLTIRNTSGGHSFDQTEYYSGQNSRSEMQFVSGDIKGHHRAVIRRRGLDKIQVYDLDVDAGQYVSYQTDLRGGVPVARP